MTRGRPNSTKTAEKTPERSATKNVLFVGDSHSNNLDKNTFEEYTETQINMVKAYTVDADENAKYKEKNLLTIVPNELQKNEYDFLVLQSGCNEITNLNCETNPAENAAFWEQVVYLSSEKLYDLAKRCVAQQNGLKVIILARLPRYDLSSVDPKHIKNKLTHYGNNVLTNLWMKDGCPDNILIADQNLGCYGELRNKRFGHEEESFFDGIHMRGPLAMQHYTNSVLRIFKESQPSLQNKPLPKVTKPRQQRTPRQYQQLNNLSNQNRRQRFNTRYSNTSNINQEDSHTDCPQARFQAWQHNQQNYQSQRDIKQSNYQSQRGMNHSYYQSQYGMEQSNYQSQRGMSTYRHENSQQGKTGSSYGARYNYNNNQDNIRNTRQEYNSDHYGKYNVRVSNRFNHLGNF